MKNDELSSDTKYPCFLCLWDSTAKDQHWIRREWPCRDALVQGEPNINEALVERKKNIFPPLLIKLGLIKQFVKDLDQKLRALNSCPLNFLHSAGEIESRNI